MDADPLNEFLKMRQERNDFKDLIELPFFISMVK